MLGLLFRNRFTTGLTVAALLIGGAWSWHLIDKGSAVKQAVVKYVAGAELAAAEAEAAELRQILAATREANRMLVRKIQAAEAEAAAIAQEIEEYERDNQINADGVVDRGVFDRLRGK